MTTSARSAVALPGATEVIRASGRPATKDTGFSLQDRTDGIWGRAAAEVFRRSDEDATTSADRLFIQRLVYILIG